MIDRQNISSLSYNDSKFLKAVKCNINFKLIILSRLYNIFRYDSRNGVIKKWYLEIRIFMWERLHHHLENMRKQNFVSQCSEFHQYVFVVMLMCFSIWVLQLPTLILIFRLTFDLMSSHWIIFTGTRR